MKTDTNITNKTLEKSHVSKTELAHFKQILSKSGAEVGNIFLYNILVKKTWTYRGIFAALSLLFFYMVLAIYPKSFSWTASILFGSLISVKTLIIAGCLAIGAIAALIGLSLCPIKESVSLKVSKAYKELWKIHEGRRLKKGINWFTSCTEKLHQKSVLHHLYQDVCDKIDETSIEIQTLMHAINKREKMTPEYKERLIEQALDELDGKLEQHLNNFRSSWIE